MDNDQNANIHIVDPTCAALVDSDIIQERLDSVSRRLLRPHFLQNISCSRLPSQAASDGSLSPGEVPNSIQSRLHLAPGAPVGETARSPLHTAVQYLDLDDLDFEDFADFKDEHHDTELASIESFILEERIKGIGDTISTHPRRKLHQLEHSFVQGWRAFSSIKSEMATDRGFSTFDHGHNDIVLAVDFNFYGKRMVTASSDHRLKVWDLKDESWTLIDTWRAHDAEIVDVKWNGPFMGEIIGSVAEDGHFKLWEEDVLETPHSGRRFKRISPTMRSETKVPFCSLDFKNLHTETYVALITRDGYLSIYEPEDHDNLSGQWLAMAQKYVCATPSRQDETGFRVAWHKEKVPCWTAVEAGLDKKALSLAVAAMNVVKIYRTDKERRWYLATELTGARNIIRDVAWANGSMRGFDVIATASKDGAVRVYEVSTIPDQAAQSNSETPSAADSLTSQTKPPKNTPSGIGAGLAGAMQAKDTPRDSEMNSPGRVKHLVKNVAELNSHGGAVWRVAFSQLGDLLVSTGDDGSVRTWKKALNGQWMEYAQVDLAANDP